MKRLYHASRVSGLKRLEPHQSTHKCPYVYATQSKLAAMLFGAPKDDFDLLIDFENGKPVLYECYPNALKEVYSGKKCSIYTVEETGFQKGVTGWEGEWVCRSTVDVVHEEVVADLYKQLMGAFRAKECIIHFFSQEEEYLSLIREELQARVEAFGITEEQMRKDARFSKYHQRLLSYKGCCHNHAQQQSHPFRFVEVLI